MTAVTRRGAHRLADPNLARGAGETSLRNPNRSPLDYQNALQQTAMRGGEAIKQAISEGTAAVIELLRDATGLDFTTFETFIASLRDRTGLDLAELDGILAGLITFDWLDRLVQGSTDDPGFPYELPITWEWETGAPLTGAAAWFVNFRKFLNDFDLSIDPADFDPLDLAAQFSEHILEPIGRLATATGLNAVATTVNQIGDIVNGLIVTPINTTVANFATWFASLLGFQQTTNQTIVNQQNQTNTIVTASYRNPAWVCRYPIGDVTYPEFFNARIDVLGETDPGGDDGHQHGLSGSDENGFYDAFAATVNWDFGAGVSRGGYITISNTTVMDTVGFIGRNVGGTSLNNVFAEVFRETGTGGLARVSSVNVAPLFTADPSYIEAAIPQLVVHAGDRYVVRVRNSCTTPGAVVGITCIRITPGMVQSAFETAGPVTAQTSLTAAEAAAARNQPEQTCAWALLAARNIAPTEHSFTDDFNRGSLGGLWVLKSDTGAQLTISGNRMVNSVAFGGSKQTGIYTGATVGDGALVQCNVYGTGSAGNTSWAGPHMHADSDLSQLVWLAVSSGIARIYSGAHTALAQRATANVSGNDALWALVYSPTTNTYTALKNGQEIGLSWTDSGNVIVHDNSRRSGGARIEKSEFSSAPQIDNWTLRDWAA